MSQKSKIKTGVESQVDTDKDGVRTEQGEVQTDPSKEPKVNDGKPMKPNKMGRIKSVVKLEAIGSMANRDKHGAGSSSSPAPGIGVMSSMSYGGNDEAAFASSRASASKVTESTRSDSRFRKKFDLPVTKVNEIISEQAYIEVESLPNLGESGSDEGYVGTRRPSAIPIQKRSGAHVASPMYSRSLDEIRRDELLFTHGQVVKVDGRPSLNAPVSVDYLDDNREEYVASHVDPQIRGNYVPRALKVSFTEDNRISSFTFEVDDISTVLESSEELIANNSATHQKVFESNAELTRQRMEDKAGNETEPGWSPLPRAVAEPTATIGYLHDLEADAGAVIATAYNKLSTALAYQINRTAKDGADPMTPIIESVISPLQRVEHSVDIEGIDIFGDDVLQAGAATLFIKMFDSYPKYDSKGAFLTLPKSFKSVLPVAEKHVAGLKVSSQYTKLLRNHAVFSTIGKDYDPLSPVYMTDNVVLAHPYDWNEQFSFTELKADGTPDPAYTRQGYSYMDYRNRYQTNMDHFLLRGIHDYLSQFASNIRKAGNFGDEDFSLTIPIIYSQTSITLWELIVLAATPYIQRRRLHSMREIIDYTNNHGYPFEDLEDLSSNLFGGGKNIGFVDISTPLKVTKMSTIDSITWIMPELFIRIDEGNDTSFILPWYFNERQITFSTTGGWAMRGDKPHISYPILRSGVTLPYLDDILSIDPKQLRLSMDIMTKIPFAPNTGTTYNSYPLDVYKYDLGTDGLLRLTIGEKSATIADLLSTPRQQGLRVVLPYGVSIPISTSLPDSDSFPYADITNNKYIPVLTSYRAKVYFNAQGPVRPTDSDWTDNINNPSTVNHGVGANYKQAWAYSYAGNAADAIINDIPLSMIAGLRPDTVVVPGVNPGDEYRIAAVPGVTQFSPFVRGHGNNLSAPTKVDDGTTRLTTLATINWVRLNMMSFILSPWDTVWSLRTGVEDGLKVDPFDFAYTYGLSGFFASDYEEALNTRIMEMDEAGLYYTEDKWAEMSPLLQ